MIKKTLHQSLAVAVGFALFAGSSAHAVDLVAIGKLSGDLHDLSGRTELLESIVPADLLGGVGSGLAWAGGDTFLALPDRGPNAVAWNSNVDNTTTYVPRFHELRLQLAQEADSVSGLPFTLRPTLLKTTLLYSHSPLNYGPVVPEGDAPSRHFFSGRSDNFDPLTSSADTADARFDPEGIRVSRNGRFVYISDEYGPYIYTFDRATGARTSAIALPADLAVANKSAHGSDEISGNVAGRVANKGMEGLAISPDGTTLFGFVQSPLIEDGGDGGRANRIVRIDLETGATTQYAYDNYLADKSKAFNSSELLALNDHELLVLERDGKGLGDDSNAAVKRVYKIDLAGAEDVSNLAGASALLAKAVSKTLFLDVFNKLKNAGVTVDQIPAKLEGMAFGEDVIVGGETKHTLYIGNDNDFLAETPAHKDNPNQWFVFTFTDADLGGSRYEPQAFNRNPANH
ncbi:MAG: esterase-like activity of phytase family protein [Gammaproteobacteria bacterium]|nr:esterase-like activity of phytase family protein [Gammaproteobacteria bacterium]